MRRASVLTILLLAALAAFAPSAWATFHLNVVNEVLLASSGGDSSTQFVEFLDNGGSEEQFTPVFAPYELVVYDAAGNRLGAQTLDPNGLRAAAAADREYLLSTAAADAAFGVTGDERLTVSLPPGAGQACFESGNQSPSAFSCLTWGTIVKPVQTNSNGTGTAHGAAPPNGESDQRQPDGSVIVATPTPRARNRSAPTAGATFAGVALARPSARVVARRARIALGCPRGSGGCSGRITLRAASGRREPLGSATFRLADGAKADVVVMLTRAARRRLAHRHRLVAVVTIGARDAAGAPATTTARLTLVRSRR